MESFNSSHIYKTGIVRESDRQHAGKLGLLLLACTSVHDIERMKNKMGRISRR